MKIHEVERICHMSKDALIYYEKEGLLLPERDANGYRCYNLKDIDTLRLIAWLRSMKISIKDIQKVIKGELSIRNCLESRQNVLQKEKHQWDNIDEKIRQYLRRKEVYAAFEPTQDLAPDVLVFSKEGICYLDQVILYQDIDRIRLSMCSVNYSVNIFHMFFHFYVDMDIESTKESGSFQIMNEKIFAQVLNVLKEHHVVLDDPLHLEDIYSRYSDDYERYKYIERHFHQWAKRYHLDNPRGNFWRDVQKKMDNHK